MKRIIILIFSIMFVWPFGCFASNAVQILIAENSVEPRLFGDGRIRKQKESIAENSAEPLPNPEQSVESEAGAEHLSANEECDPFGAQIWKPGTESYFPLYAMIKEEDIYLYGIYNGGMILYQNGRGTYFDWPGITGRAILPQMLYHDFDGDGKKELAVTLYWGAGTGFGAMDLHILEIGDEDRWEKPLYTDYVLSALDVTDWMKEPIIAILTEDKKTLIVEACGSYYEIEGRPEDTFEGIVFGNFVHFDFEGTRIKVSIAVAAEYEESPATPDYFGEIEAYVTFDGEKFILEDYTFCR